MRKHWLYALLLFIIPLIGLGYSITCLPGQTPQTIRDCDVCGEEIEMTNIGAYGICVNFCCPEIIGLSDVHHCNVGKTDDPLVCESLNFERIELYLTKTIWPGECISYPIECEETINYIKTGEGSYWCAVRSVYRYVCNYCEICVEQPCADECQLGKMRCGSGSAVEVCNTPNEEKPCLHWEYYYDCPENKICREVGEEIRCIKTCSDDAECESTQYCGYEGELKYCLQKKKTGEFCTRNNECRTGLCQDGKCKQVVKPCLDTGEWGCGFVLGKECCDPNARCEGIPILKMIIGGTCVGGGNVICDKNLAYYDRDVCIACGGIWHEEGILTGVWEFLFGGAEQVKCELPSFLILKDIFFYAIIFIIVVGILIIIMKKVK